MHRPARAAVTRFETTSGRLLAILARNHFTNQLSKPLGGCLRRLVLEQHLLVGNVSAMSVTASASRIAACASSRASAGTVVGIEGDQRARLACLGHRRQQVSRAASSRIAKVIPEK